jgi:hypothetical protein
MRFAMNIRSLTNSVAVAAAVVTFAHASPGRAETAYISQAVGSVGAHGFTMPLTSASPQASAPFGASRSRPTLPEMAVPRVTGGNYASTLQIGSYNSVFQAQSGFGNYSNVGIIGGNHNAVGVLQSGNNLRSNLVLLGTSGTSVGVLQGNGAAPVNLLIGRLPNGALLIGGLPIRR